MAGTGQHLHWHRFGCVPAAAKTQAAPVGRAGGGSEGRQGQRGVGGVHGCCGDRVLNTSGGNKKPIKVVQSEKGEKAGWVRVGGEGSACPQVQETFRSRNAVGLKKH